MNNKTPTDLKVGQIELDLPVEPSRPDEGRVKCVGAVGCHENFDVATRIKSIELINELKHRTLDLIVSASAVIKACAWQT